MNSFQEEVVALSPRLGPSSPIFWRNVHDKKKNKTKAFQMSIPIVQKSIFLHPNWDFRDLNRNSTGDFPNNRRLVEVPSFEGF
jgi:hypothetical protein